MVHDAGVPRSGKRGSGAWVRYFRTGWTVLLGLALLYVGWVFFSRWQENREIQRREAARKRAEDQRTLEMLGAGRFEILSFYATPGIIARGETAELCYSVSNAKSVRLEPQSSPVWPSYSRCVTVSPQKTTTYTLAAEDSAGHTKTATLLLQVR